MSLSETFVDLFHLTPALIGLALSKAFLLLGEFQYMTRVSCVVENLLTSLERILEYSQLPDEIDTETKKEKFNRERAKRNLERILKANDQNISLFDKGEISLKNFSYSYSNNVPILKDISLEFKSGEKIGIIGRTGAGKSSLISAFYRIRKPLEGTIGFNGRTDYGLHELRKNLAIIPQEPIIFSDTLRRNLDPFNSYGEDYLWQIVESVGLKQKFKNENKGMNRVNMG